MDSTHFDIVIVGAGLAGLSLATRLCTPQFAHLRIAVVDPRTTFGATHTWSFFQQEWHGFENCVASNRQWCNIRVHAAGVQLSSLSRAHDFAATPYCSIESTIFYEKSLQLIAGNARIQDIFGHYVESIVVEKDATATVRLLNVATNSARSLTARLVFDSRPPIAMQVSKQAWIQAFAGGEVTCAAPHFADLFAQGEAVLMDFDVDGGAAFVSIPTFVYLLPSSPTRALVQATSFVPPGARVPSDGTLRALALQYLQTKFACIDIVEQRFEAGRIVMDAAIPATTTLQTITKIGAAGGFVRASTGYSFTRTQRACGVLENAVIRVFPAGFEAKNILISVPIDRWQSPLVPLMDAVFLEALATPNFDVGKLMATLFNRVSPARLARFLDGNMTFLDAFAVVMACPKWVFVRSFFVCAWRFLNCSGGGEK